MARRTTLGVVPSSFLNGGGTSGVGTTAGKGSRVSMGPARIAAAASSGMPPSRASVGAFGAFSGAAGGSGAPLSRPSMSGAASAVHRRSSAGIRGSKDDPRPIMTAAFLREGVDTLIQFMISHQYDRDISPKVLKSPTATEFENIFVFLAKQFDPTFKIKDKVPNDVPELLKSLKYAK